MESYFEYILAQCSDTVIPRVCFGVKTKEQLISSAQNGFNGEPYILGQHWLISAADDLLSVDGYLTYDDFGNDGQKVHIRCKRALDEMLNENWQHIDIDKDRLFDVLVEVNWLLASKHYHVQNQKSGPVLLLGTLASVFLWTKKALNEIVLKNALCEQDRMEQYKTAQLKRYQVFRGCHPDQEVRDFYAQGYTYSDFKELQDQARNSGIRHMALFYGLTATAAFAEELRRM